MKLNNLVVWFFALTALVLPFLVLLELKYVGFPDGYITEYGATLKILGSVFIVFSILYSIYFFYTAWRGFKNSNKQLYISIILYCTLVAIFIAVNYYLRLHLNNGVGG
jgi:hypothetical protein